MYPQAVSTIRPHEQVPRWARLLAIIVVFAMGAAFALPQPVAAQVTGSVTGTVTDLDGAALADAEVILKKRINGSLWSYHETRTDDAGAFAFAGLEPGTWELDARLDGYHANDTSVTVATGQDAQVSVRLASLTERLYTGTVFDSSDKSTIGGAIVKVTGYGSGESLSRETKSDANGTFSIRLFADENQITITRSGYAPYHDWVYRPNGIIAHEVWLTPVPPQSAEIVGRVVDGAGNGVHAFVSLYPSYDDCCADSSGGSSGSTSDSAAMIAPDRPYPYYNHNATETAKDGTFTMNAYPGTVHVQADRQGYLVASQTVTLTEDGKSEVTLTLAKLPERTVTLTGTITDAASGEPVPGANVNVQVPGAGDRQWVQADADGKYSVQVRPGYTLLEVRVWGHCCFAYSEVAVAEDTDASASEGSDDAPSNSSRIMPEPMPMPTKSYYPVSLTFTTTADQTRTTNVKLEPKPEPETVVVGYVLDADDQGVAGAHLSFQNHATGEWGQATTDENGSYKITTYGGYHTVSVWADGHLPYATNVRLPDSGSERLDLRVVAGEYAQEGWWSPDGNGGCCYAEPMPYGVDDVAYAESSGGGDGMRSTGKTGSESRSAGVSGDGPEAYEGSGGGLPAYDPAKKDDTFGHGSVNEAPVSPLMGLVVALGALAVVAGLRRR